MVTVWPFSFTGALVNQRIYIQIQLVFLSFVGALTLFVTGNGDTSTSDCSESSVPKGFVMAKAPAHANCVLTAAVG